MVCVSLSAPTEMTAASTSATSPPPTNLKRLFVTVWWWQFCLDKNDIQALESYLRTAFFAKEL